MVWVIHELCNGSPRLLVERTEDQEKSESSFRVDVEVLLLFSQRELCVFLFLVDQPESVNGVCKLRQQLHQFAEDQWVVRDNQFFYHHLL